VKPLAEQTHYEVLEVEPSASYEEIRASYERIRRLLGPGSLATYALVEPEEAQAHLLRIDEAWAVLSDPAERRRYDVSLGLAPPEEAPPQRATFADALAAIGRAGSGAAPASRHDEPEEIALDEDDLLEVVEIAAAGIVVAQPRALEAPPRGRVVEGWEEPLPVEPEAILAAEEIGAVEEPPGPIAAPPLAVAGSPGSSGSSGAAAPLPACMPPEPLAAGAPPAGSFDAAEPSTPLPAAPPAPASGAASPGSSAAAAPRPAGSERSAPPTGDELPPLGPGTVFTGALLRTIRRARGLTLDELARRTRIHAAHFANIEEERWAELPERVFLRGYLDALARELRLDPAQVCASFLARRPTSGSR